MTRKPTLAVMLTCFALFTAYGSVAESAEQRKLLLLGQSPDGHPPGTHEYMAGVSLIAKLLGDNPHLETTVIKADDPWPDGPEQLAKADGVVLFVSEGAKWIRGDQRRAEAFARLAERGGGLAVIHWGMGTRDAENIAGFLALFGGCHGGPDRKYKVVEEASILFADATHPIVSGIKPFVVRDEFYYRLKFVKADPSVTPILQTEIDGQLETVGWAWQRPDGGRSIGFSGCHFHDNWQREEYRRLVAQAVLWTLKSPVPESGVSVDIDEADLKLE